MYSARAASVCLFSDDIRITETGHFILAQSAPGKARRLKVRSAAARSMGNT